MVVESNVYDRSIQLPPANGAAAGRQAAARAATRSRRRMVPTWQLPEKLQDVKLRVVSNRRCQLRALILSVLVIAACGKSGANDAARRDTLTERQHDSILARSQIPGGVVGDRKSTRLNSSHLGISYAVF